MNKKIIIALVGLFFATRLFNLTVLPIFTDESIYIYWAKYIATVRSHWFLSLTDGKPPLLIWMISFLLTILPHSFYLVAGRLPSVVSGLIGLIGIYKLAKILLNSEKAGVIAAALFIINPFILLYDRLAIYDSMLSAFLIWTIYFAVKTSKFLRLKDALFWGIFLGLSFYAKPTAILFIVLSPLCALFLLKRKSPKRDWGRLLGLSFFALAVGEGLNNLQRVSHVYSRAAIKNQEFQQPINELFKNPLALTWGNMQGFITWITAYYSLPFVIIGLVAFIFLMVKKPKEGVILFSLWVLPLLILATIGRIVFPRYILFTTPYFIIPLAYGISMGFEKRKSVIFGTIFLLVIILASQIKMDYFLLTDPSRSSIPATDYNQYVSEHPSGYGLSKIFEIINKEAKDNPGKKIFIVTQGTFGIYPYAFNLEYWNNKQIEVMPRWPLEKLDNDIYNASKKGSVFIVFKEKSGVPQEMPLKIILKSQKPGGNFPIYLTTFK